jgi:hypothetical protein
LVEVLSTVFKTLIEVLSTVFGTSWHLPELLFDIKTLKHDLSVSFMLAYLYGVRHRNMKKITSTWVFFQSNPETDVSLTGSVMGGLAAITVISEPETSPDASVRRVDGGSAGTSGGDLVVGGDSTPGVASQLAAPTSTAPAAASGQAPVCNNINLCV